MRNPVTRLGRIKTSPELRAKWNASTLRASKKKGNIPYILVTS